MERNSKKRAREGIEVVVVEENPASRRRLGNLINRSEGMRCAANYQNAFLALHEIKKTKPDVVVTDLMTSGMYAGEFPSKLRSIFPSAKVIVLTDHEDGVSVIGSIQNGALGYILRSEPLSAVIEGIRIVMNGGSPMTARVARVLVGSIQKGKARKKMTLPLTFRESQILSSAAIGLRAREIGRLYAISEYTVRAHLRKIYTKLHVTRRCEAVLKFLQCEYC